MNLPDSSTATMHAIVANRKVYLVAAGGPGMLGRSTAAMQFLESFELVD